jgi:hypothetical protein
MPAGAQLDAGWQTERLKYQSRRITHSFWLTAIITILYNWKLILPKIQYIRKLENNSFYE